MSAERRRERGMALIQALVIVAAIAAVSAALLLRADTARQRLQTRFQADQAALILDSGVAMVAALVQDLPYGSAVHHGQAWAQQRDEVRVDQGLLAWRVDDLQGRFNVSDMAGEGPQAAAARAAFLRLAAGYGLRRETLQRLAEALGSVAPHQMADLRQLAALAQDQAPAFTQLSEVLAVLPAGRAVNINTVSAQVFAAIMPDIPDALRTAVLRHVRRTPFLTRDALLTWVQDALGPAFVPRFEALGLSTTSTWFAVSLDARLDSVRLRRSVVLFRDAAQACCGVYLSMPEPE